MDSLNDKFFSDEFCNAILENFINHRATAAELRAAGFEAHASEVVRATILDTARASGSNLLAVRELKIPEKGGTCDIAVADPGNPNLTWMPVEYVFELKTNYGKQAGQIQERIQGKRNKNPDKKKKEHLWTPGAIEQANTYSNKLGELQSGKRPPAFVVYITANPSKGCPKKPRNHPFNGYLTYAPGERDAEALPENFMPGLNRHYRRSGKTVSFMECDNPINWDITVTLIACDRIRSIPTDTPDKFGTLQAC